MRKVLAIQPRIPLSKLHQAISRAYRPVRLPEWVLSTICGQLSWCQVSGQHAEARVAPGEKELFVGGEAILCSVLREHGGVLPLARLEELCGQAGVKKENLWRVLCFSAVIERFGKGTYGLIGARDPHRAPGS